MRSHWRKAWGIGLGYYVAGPVGALLGYVIGRVAGEKESHVKTNPKLRRYYETLEIPPTSSIEEVKKSYRTLVRRYHPDINRPADERGAMLLKEKMAAINEAYRELSRVHRPLR
jgi:DnaJ-domain-containing protein 1